MDLQNAKPGDRFTVEFEVVHVGQSIVSARPLGSQYKNYGAERLQFDPSTPINSLTPKPIEITRGFIFGDSYTKWKVVHVEDDNVFYINILGQYLIPCACKLNSIQKWLENKTYSQILEGTENND
jgi:hypothetical protein